MQFIFPRTLSLTLAAFAAFATGSQLASAANIGTLTNLTFNSAPTSGNYTNASSIAVNTTHDIILNAAPIASTYSPCCEAAGPPAGTTAPLTDGQTAWNPSNFGNPALNPSENTQPQNALFDLNNNWYVEYQLNAPPGLHYDINSISVTTGHQDGRANQTYDVLVSNDGVNFTSLSDLTVHALGAGGTGFSYNPSNGDGGAAQSTIVSANSDPVLASNVKFVEFLMVGTGNGDVYRELTVNGVATPEPSTFILGGLGLVGLFIAARRRKA